MLQIVQLGLVSTDLPGTLRLYSEAFGFRNAGAQCAWGESGARITGLRPDQRMLMWWLVGSKKFFQLELFHYSCPVPQPLPADWRPSDHGWNRFGVVVADFDACLNGLKRNGVEPLAPAVTKAGLRRVAIRDPFIGAIIEVMESDPKQPDGPAIAYATSSVADLESARAFYGGALELEILPLEHLHSPSDEALWGLAGAERDGFLVRAGDRFLEVVSYRNPPGRPKPTGYQLSDQGIMNVAFASRQLAPVARALERVEAAGYIPPYVYNDGKIIAAYLVDPKWVLEFGAVPEEVDVVYGFVPAPFGFMGGGVVELPKQT